LVEKPRLGGAEAGCHEKNLVSDTTD